MNIRPLITALSVLLACSASSAQTSETKKTSDLIVLHLSDGRDSLISNVKFTGSDSICLWQRQMSYMKGDSVLVVRPEQVRRVKRGYKHFWSQLIETSPGVVEQLMVQRSYNGGDEWPSLFRFYPERGKSQDYVQVQGGVLKYIDPRDPDNAFRHELRRKNTQQGGNVQIDRRLSRLKASRFGLREARKLIKSQNDNMIPCSRYGLGVGLFGNNTQLTLHDENSSQVLPSKLQLQLTATAWADFRSLEGVSLHPELTFQKTSSHVQASSPEGAELAFNRTQLSMPLLGRYTCVQMRGQWLPFIEGGMQLNLTLRNECRLQYAIYDSEDYVSSMRQMGFSKNCFWANPLAGLGLEYRLTPRRSLFLDVRYLFDITSEVENVLDVKQGGWMASLSINL